MFRLQWLVLHYYIIYVHLELVLILTFEIKCFTKDRPLCVFNAMCHMFLFKFHLLILISIYFPHNVVLSDNLHFKGVLPFIYNNILLGNSFCKSAAEKFAFVSQWWSEPRIWLILVYNSFEYYIHYIFLISKYFQIWYYWTTMMIYFESYFKSKSIF